MRLLITIMILGTSFNTWGQKGTKSQGLDSLFYFLTKQTIGESDKIFVNIKARIPTPIWDTYWNRMKQNAYFDSSDSEFVKSQIQNPVISKWNRKKLGKIKITIPPDETATSDEAIVFTKTLEGRTTYFIGLPLVSANKKKVVIIYIVKNSRLGHIGEFTTVWTLENNIWTAESSGVSALF